jgi:hypothetical protein
MLRFWNSHTKALCFGVKGKGVTAIATSKISEVIGASWVSRVKGRVLLIWVM